MATVTKVHQPDGRLRRGYRDVEVIGLPEASRDQNRSAVPADVRERIERRGSIEGRRLA